MAKATVKINLHDTGEVELVPSLAAMEYLGKQVDNFQAVYAKLASMNFDMYAHVIVAGTSHLPKAASFKACKEEVFETGVITLMPQLIRFVSILLNGGKEPEASSEEATSKNPE